MRSTQQTIECITLPRNEGGSYIQINDRLPEAVAVWVYIQIPLFTCVLGLAQPLHMSSMGYVYLSIQLWIQPACQG